MSIDVLFYLCVVSTLGLVMLTLMFHYFRPKNKEYVERAKYAMFDEDDDADLK